jgi:hypothetical protein
VYRSSMDTFEIVMVVFLALMALTFVYAVARLVWRLHTGDVESAGSDGNAITNRD